MLVPNCNFSNNNFFEIWIICLDLKSLRGWRADLKVQCEIKLKNVLFMGQSGWLPSHCNSFSLILDHPVDCIKAYTTCRFLGYH